MGRPVWTLCLVCAPVAACQCGEIALLVVGDAGPSKPDGGDAGARGSGSSAGDAGPVVTTTPPPSDPSCLQALADTSQPPPTARYVYPRHPVTPFYRWKSNNGYGGEVSMIQAGLNGGQWMSQLNARLVCGATGNGSDAPLGTPLSQSGPNGFCAANGNTADFNAQFLLEDDAAASAATCLASSRLAFQTYDYSAQSAGITGYQDFMSWIKAETIAGHQVTTGVMDKNRVGGTYAHIVTIMAVGTNHAATDATYYDDDVLYFDDHGAFTTTGANPSIPPGTGGTAGCTPYLFGYTFGALAMTTQQLSGGSQLYAILIPGVADMPSDIGGNGVGAGPPVTGHNYGFSVSGPADEDGTTLPVTVGLAGTTSDGGANPPDPLAGYDYENPYIGTSDQGGSCTNVAPAPMGITLAVTVAGLTPGGAYNLYEYDFDAVSGTGAAAALAVPTASFNAQASLATAATPIVASGPTFETQVTRTAFQTVVFRAVAATAP